jgi:hypothetical protein
LGGKGGRKIPYAFTEQGVAMLAAVLKSDIAVKISIKIIKLYRNAEIHSDEWAGISKAGQGRGQTA